MYVALPRMPLIMTLLALSGCGSPAVPTVAVGQPMPTLVLPGLDAADLDLAQQRGRVVVLHIWATWCPPCRTEMPLLEQFAGTLDKSRFLLVGLAAEHDANLVREFNLRHGITFARHIDPDLRLSNGVLNISAFPTTLIIGRDGALLHHLSGVVDWAAPATRQLLESAWTRTPATHITPG